MGLQRELAKKSTVSSFNRILCQAEVFGISFMIYSWAICHHLSKSVCVNPFCDMWMCMSMACYSMLFHVCTFFHFVRLGQNREWNAAAFEAKSSHWSCRCSKLCTLAATLWNMNWLQVDLIPKFIMASGDLAQRWDEKSLAGPQCIGIALHSGIGIQAERWRRREIREILWAEVKILLKTRVSRYLEFRTETLEDFWELSSFCAWWGYTSVLMMLPLCDFLTLMYMLCLCNWNSDK